MSDKNKWMISTVVAVLGVIIPIALYIASLPDRALSYHVASKTDLVSQIEEIDSIEIRIKGVPIDSAYLYSLKLNNSGTEPIMARDFEKPLLVKFDEKVFSVKVKEKSPKNLMIKYGVFDNEVSIAPFLFNVDEAFVLEILSASNNYPIIDSRIAGISTVDERYPSEESNIKRVLSLFLSVILIIYYSKSGYNAFAKEGFLSLPLVRIGNAVLSITCAISSFFFLNVAVNIERYRFIIYAALTIPIIIGVYLARKEQRYSKSIGPTADEAAD